ncbi:MAG: G5 domain-containing protein [Candidatus Moranbacteria bacterium]|nr:G5 domain-containing protein [Candidatus Moranbacteria bacterium]
MLKKRYKLILIMAGISLGALSWRSFFDEKVVASQSQDFLAEKVQVAITDNGLNFEVSSRAKTVGEFVDEQQISLNQNDAIFPDRNEKMFAGAHIIIQRAKKITVKEGGKTKQIYTLQNTIEQAIWDDKNIELDEDDVTVPARNMPVKDGMIVAVTHVLIKEETKNVDIPFKTISNEDDTLGWRIKKTTQKGEVGTKEVKYKVVYNDGKEISRKVLESNQTKDPVDEIVTQGTFVKVGKTYSGAASWYAYTGTLSAANPWLPMGSFARVTNKDNGKTVIVKINDRGPFGNGRIIDLDKVAFNQIADLGAGVANVKVEAITN